MMRIIQTIKATHKAMSTPRIQFTINSNSNSKFNSFVDEYNNVFDVTNTSKRKIFLISVTGDQQK